MLARWLLTVLAGTCPGADVIGIRAPATTRVFATCECAIDLPAPLTSIPAAQIQDAYDADRDGHWIRGEVRFQHEGEAALVIPMFAMRSAPAAGWQWRVRWMPIASGTWTAIASVVAGLGGPPYQVTSAPITIAVVADPALVGPLVAPAPGDDPRWLRVRRSDGTTRATWLFGACRAWDVASDPHAGGWSACEGIDRDRDLFPALRENGYNLLNQWMAPWEYLLVHRDHAEFWRGADGRWTRSPLPAADGAAPAALFDQGRAAAFDDLEQACAGSATQSTVRLLLSMLPHQMLQMRAHPWGGNESGWSPEDDHGSRPLSQLNGFSAEHPGGPSWDFFAADPRQPLSDWRSRLFDREANFFRYVIARWGSSRALGLWVLIDELDGVGDSQGSVDAHSGWWAHPACDRWMADVKALFQGHLTRGDGLPYAGDPYHHPIHAATSSLGDGVGARNNLTWDGGSAATRPDVVGWHWYPSWGESANWTTAWTTTIDGILAFSDRPLAWPRLISEFGAPDRATPTDPPSALFPTLYHLAIWAAICSGQAGTPMNWNDGKEFGELRARSDVGPFDATHYPVDCGVQLRALRTFLGDVDPSQLERCDSHARVTLIPEGQVRAAALVTRAGPVVMRGWLYTPETLARIRLLGLADGRWQIRWFDPWTGTPLPGPPDMLQSIQGTMIVDAQAALARLQGPRFPDATRLDRGHDVAFVLEQP